MGRFVVMITKSTPNESAAATGLTRQIELTAASPSVFECRSAKLASLAVTGRQLISSIRQINRYE
jgi:hypothetical protein